VLQIILRVASRFFCVCQLFYAHACGEQGRYRNRISLFVFGHRGVCDHGVVGWVLGGPTGPIEDTYILGKRLGEPGQYGYAQLCTKKATGEIFAVKVLTFVPEIASCPQLFSFLSLPSFACRIPLQVIAKSRYSRNKAQLDRMREEYELMRGLAHKNIIKAYDAFENKTNFYIVMEYCGGGELFTRIQEKVCPFFPSTGPRRTRASDCMAVEAVLRA
jgi:serine/threonine protein kinase